MGAGTLQLTNDDTYTGLTTVTQGTLLADGSNSANTIGAVALNGGTIGGTGTVGLISPTPPASGKNTIQPGDNTTPAGVGTLTTNVGATTETWNSSTTLTVNLVNVNQYSSLTVNGSGSGGSSLNINGATLSGVAGLGVNVNDVYTIIQAPGGITGTFNTAPFAANTVFLNGQKFTIVYNPTTVQLVRVLNNATLSVTSTANPSVYGQDVSFTATVTPQTGATALSPNDTVTFTFDNGTVIPPQNIQLVNGTATFDPETFTNQPLSIGQHSLVVSFNGDPNFAPTSNSANPFIQTVNSSLTTIVVSSPTPNPVYGQPVVLNAIISPVSPGAGIPTGTVIFTVDGIAQQPVLVAGGQAQITLTNLGTILHRVSATFTTGDNNFTSSNTASDYLFTVQKDGSQVAVSASPATPSFGQATTLTVTVSAASPGMGTPTGTVFFFNGGTIQANGTVSGGTLLANATLNNGKASIQVSTPDHRHAHHQRGLLRR